MTTAKTPSEIERLLELAREAPPPQRSRLTPYLAVVFELRGKGYSYEKIADFLVTNTGQEFTRSQVFAFVQRNSTLFGVSEQKMADEEGEALPSQLMWDHARALSAIMPKGIQISATIIPSGSTEDADKIPSPIGCVGEKFYVCYRIRNIGESLKAEWTDGRKWQVISSEDVRHVGEEIEHLFPNSGAFGQ